MKIPRVRVLDMGYQYLALPGEIRDLRFFPIVCWPTGFGVLVRSSLSLLLVSMWSFCFFLWRSSRCSFRSFSGENDPYVAIDLLSSWEERSSGYSYAAIFWIVFWLWGDGWLMRMLALALWWGDNWPIRLLYNIKSSYCSICFHICTTTQSPYCL